MRNDNTERMQLLHWISMISFALDDVELYLDTHPKDREALKYFNNYSNLRNQALEDYAAYFGPLTQDTAISDDTWEWVEYPWPWEGEFK